jgi:hypothetical protein
MRFPYVLSSAAFVAALIAPALGRTVTASVTVNGTTFNGIGGANLLAASGEVTFPRSFGNGTATAGNGSISLFANAFGTGPFSGPPSPNIGVVSRATLDDSFTLGIEGDRPVILTFAANASGNVEATVSDPTILGGSGTSAEIQWSAALSGPGVSRTFSGRVTQFFRTETNPPPARLVPVFASNGVGLDEVFFAVEVQPLTMGSYGLSLSGLAGAGITRPNGVGATASAVADFGSTLRWMGLQSATFADGTPYSGQVFSSSESGFDNRTPAPGALVLFAFGAAQAARRRR